MGPVTVFGGEYAFHISSGEHLSSAETRGVPGVRYEYPSDVVCAQNGLGQELPRSKRFNGHGDALDLSGLLNGPLFLLIGERPSTITDQPMRM